MLGFKDKQLGWIFIATGALLFLYGVTNEMGIRHHFDFSNRGFPTLVFGIICPLALYAVMRAFEAGKRGR